MRHTRQDVATYSYLPTPAGGNGCVLRSSLPRTAEALAPRRAPTKTQPDRPRRLELPEQPLDITLQGAQRREVSRVQMPGVLLKLDGFESGDGVLAQVVVQIHHGLDRFPRMPRNIVQRVMPHALGIVAVHGRAQIHAEILTKAAKRRFADALMKDCAHRRKVAQHADIQTHDLHETAQPPHSLPRCRR